MREYCGSDEPVHEEENCELTIKFGRIKTFDKNTLVKGENHGQN
jgi:hypothetical protein